MIRRIVSFRSIMVWTTLLLFGNGSSIAVESPENGDPIRVSGSVVFPVGKSELPQNDSLLNDISQRVIRLSQQEDMQLSSFVVWGLSSPEGSYRRNLQLANQRAQFLSDYVNSLLACPADAGSMKSVSDVENYNGLCEKMYQANDADYSVVRELCDKYIPTESYTELESEIRRIDNGRLWTRLANTYFSQLRQLIGKRLNQQADYVVVHNEAARWDDFRDMIAASQEPWREEVLRILDMPASEDSKTYDPREAKLRALHDGEVWSVLMDKYFPMLRSGAVAVVDWQSAREADPVQQVEVATVDTIPETQNQDAGESVAVTENNPSGDKEPVKDTTQGTAQNTTQEGTQGTAQEEQKIDVNPYSDNQSNNDNTLNNNNIDNNAGDTVSIDKETKKDAAQDTVQNTQVTLVLPSTKQNSEVPLDTTKQSRKDVTQFPSNTVSDEAFLDTSYHSLQDLVLPHAKWKRSDIASVPRLGGFVVGSYKYDNRAGEHGGEGFGVRMARLYVDGSVMRDFKYRLQVDFAGTPRLLDAFATWSHWKELEVKIGQFKRCFTFENPYNPWDVGFGDYSQLTRKFAGYGDRVGEEPVGGRDIGLQIQGDAFRSKKDGHSHLHYAVAVYNGQGMNHKDLNRQKDFIGTLQWSPVRDLYIGVFGWMGNWKSDDGVNVNRNRFAAGVKYEGSKNHWTVRAEYARSYGHKAEDFSGDVAVGSSSWTGGRLSDAWYATVGVPVWRWIKIYGKYDVYRDYATKATMHTIYAASVNLQPHKNLLLQLQYNFHQLGITTTGCYHQAWLQAYIRF